MSRKEKSLWPDGADRCLCSDESTGICFIERFKENKFECCYCGRLFPICYPNSHSVLARNNFMSHIDTCKIKTFLSVQEPLKN